LILSFKLLVSDIRFGNLHHIILSGEGEAKETKSNLKQPPALAGDS